MDELEEETENLSVPADPTVRNFSLCPGWKAYYREKQLYGTPLMVLSQRKTASRA